MDHHKDKNRYALAVGHAAIEWNYLEHDLQQIGFAYLTVDEDVAAHIFAFMGNVTRAEFIAYLIDRFENDLALAEHLKHLIAIFNRLRANRNVVEHGLPALTQDGKYLGDIIKVDRRGDALPFAASQETLDRFLKDLRAARDFASALRARITNKSDGSPLPDRPAMPKRLTAYEHRRD